MTVRQFLQPYRFILTVLAARADDVPPACMNLAAVLLDNPAQAGGPVPTPMGSASLEYTGLTEQDKTDLQNALSA